MALDRKQLADLILARLQAAQIDMALQWSRPGLIRSCVIDDLLPDEVVRAVHAAFPATERMVLRKSIRENKHIAAQMDCYDPLLEEIVYAFQDPRLVDLVTAVTGLSLMEPDTQLYAGGISAMAKGAYLRPHLDNSHDRKRERYRVLNLLYYVTPEWSAANGGSLQLWDEGPEGQPRDIESRCNRLVLMATDRHSWHSVNEVRADGVRCCVSNYYFSRVAPEEQDYFHATSFRAEYGKGLSDLAMQADNALRTTILKLTGDRLYKNPHVYQRREDEPGEDRRDVA